MSIETIVFNAFETIIDGIIAERIKNKNSQENHLRGLIDDDLKLKVLRQDVLKHSRELIELLDKANNKTLIRIYQVVP